MDAREIGAERFSQRVAVRYEQRLAREPVTGGNAANPLHDEKRASDDTQVATQKEWFGRDHASSVRYAQHRKFLRARQAHGYAGGRVRTQHETVRALPRPAIDLDVQRPVVLDCTAWQAFEGGDAHGIRPRFARAASARYRPSQSHR